MLLYRQHLRLQEVDLVGSFVHDQALPFDLVQHLLVHHAFQSFDLFVTTEMLGIKDKLTSEKLLS